MPQVTLAIIGVLIFFALLAAFVVRHSDAQENRRQAVNH